MSRPPHTGIVNLSQNPPDPDDSRRRSRKEEERRLRAVQAHIKHSAQHRLPPELAPLFKVNELPGDIPPDARPSELATKIEEKAAPKLLEISRRSAGRVDVGKIKLPNGTVMENIQSIGPSVTKISVSLHDLADVVAACKDIVIDIKNAVIGLCMRVIAAAKVLVVDGEDAIAGNESEADWLDDADEELVEEDIGIEEDNQDDNGYPRDDSSGD